MKLMFRMLPVAALVVTAACSDDLTGVAPADIPGPMFHHTAAPANVQISPAGSIVEGAAVTVSWASTSNTGGYGFELEQEVSGVWTTLAAQSGTVSTTSKNLGALSAGSYRVRVNTHPGNPGSSWSSTVAFVVNSASPTVPVDTRAPQSITGFAAPLNVKYGDHDFTFNPAATSNRAVTLTTSDDCTLVDEHGAPLASATAPAKVRVTGAGSCSVHADQAGDTNIDGDWMPVAETITFLVGRAALTVTAADKSKVYDGAAFPAADFSALYSDFVFGESPSVLGGTLSFGGAAVSAVNAGKYAIVPAGLTSANYDITFVNGELEIERASQVIDFAALGGRTFGDAAFAVSATGGASGNEVTFAAAGKCSVAKVGDDWMVSISGAGSCTITASQAGSANYFAAQDVARQFAIAKAQAAVSLSNLSHLWDGSAKSATVTTVPASLPVNVTYDGNGSAPAAPGTYAVLAEIDHADYEGSATGSLVISAWTLNGFHRPVATNHTGGPIVFNSAKAGATVALKFNVFAGGTERTDVAAVQALNTQRIVCDASAAEAAELMSSTGGTSLRYSGTPGLDGHFMQNWQTPKAAGCYRATVTTLDGSSIVAYFNLK